MEADETKRLLDNVYGSKSLITKIARRDRRTGMMLTKINDFLTEYAVGKIMNYKNYSATDSPANGWEIKERTEQRTRTKKLVNYKNYSATVGPAGRWSVQRDAGEV